MMGSDFKLMQITAYSDADFTVPVGAPYSLMINPDSLKRNRGIINSVPGDDISFNTVIDCTGVVDPARTDMDVEIKALENVVYTFNGDIHAPNFVKIEWGGHLNFKGRLTTFDINYTLFRPDGSPLRAKIALAFTTYTPNTRVTGLLQQQQLDAAASEQLYTILGGASIKGVAAKQLQLILFKRLTQPVATNKVTADTIWPELAWDICIKQGISKKAFTTGIEKIKHLLPPLLQTTWTNFNNQPDEPFAVADKGPVVPPVLQKKNTTINAGNGIAVKNAGLVLINSYIPMLFQKLGLTEDKVFLNAGAQERAIYYLQYTATGLFSSEEAYLPLNKLLCGVPIAQPVSNVTTIADDEVQLINGLIEAMIGYWPAIGSTSIEGFRGNWLLRDGLLAEQEERWELTVEKRAYDLLINQSPFSFSIIMLPWMEKPLHINWGY